MIKVSGEVILCSLRNWEADESVGHLTYSVEIPGHNRFMSRCLPLESQRIIVFADMVLTGVGLVVFWLVLWSKGWKLLLVGMVTWIEGSWWSAVRDGISEVA